MRIARSLSEQAAYLGRRKAELGLDHIDRDSLRNSGRQRTATKRALLAKLDELAGEQGREVPFPGNY